MSDAGVLDTVDEEALARYCEAFANWCTDGDQLAARLIDLGLTASRRVHAEAYVSQSATPPPPATHTGPESIRRAPNAIMRRAEIESETGLSRSTIHQRIKAGTFPKPVHLGARSVGWRVADIDAFCQRQPTTGHQTAASEIFYGGAFCALITQIFWWLTEGLPSII